jgi:hypothetical protein
MYTGGMKVKLYDGPVDGLEVDVPEPLPKYVEVDTGRGDSRRTHVYALRGDRYVFLRTRKEPRP